MTVKAKISRVDVRRATSPERAGSDIQFLEAMFENFLGEGWAAEILNKSENLQSEFRKNGEHPLVAMMAMELAVREIGEFFETYASPEAGAPADLAGLLKRSFKPFADGMTQLRYLYRQKKAN